jgi:hypothetical protein
VDNVVSKSVKIKKSKNRNLVLMVVNGVAKWVDASEASERFTDLPQERLSSRHFARTNMARTNTARKNTARYPGELE